MSGVPLSLTDRAERPSLARLARVEARKMIDTRAGFWLLLLTVLAAIGGVVGERLAPGGDDVSIGAMYLTATAIISVLLPIVGILLVTGEWSQRTGLITFALVPVRWRVVAAKLFAALGVAFAGAAVCLLLAAIGGTTSGGSAPELSELGYGLLNDAIAVSIGVGLGLALMNSPAAIVLFFVGPLLVGTLGVISDSIEDVTVWLDQSVLITLGENGPEGDDWAKIAVTVAVWALVPLVAGMLRLQRGDID